PAWSSWRHKLEASQDGLSGCRPVIRRKKYATKNPNGPFVAVSNNGELLPEVKQVISIIAKHGLTLASGHILAEETLMVFRAAKRQGVQHMIATHAFDLSGKMTVEQMQEAAKL